MHPILGDRRRLFLYLLAWALVGGVLALLLRTLMDVPWRSALAFALPLAFVAAPVSLSAWYLCRAMPLARTSAVRVASTALVAALLTASLWAAAGRAWWQVLTQLNMADRPASSAALTTLVVGLGALAYLLSVTVHYVLQAFEESAAAARKALEADVAHREAELRALRAQVDPHFLFNSLNSISGLIVPAPDRARLMCQLLADFLRDSLTLGGSRRIALAREVGLAEQYLRVEQVRFGQRLTVQTSVASDCADVPVPPLILQPLVENAVRHGIATMLEGGVVEIAAYRDGGRAVMVVTQSARPGGKPSRHRVRCRHRAAAAGRLVRRTGVALDRSQPGIVSGLDVAAGGGGGSGVTDADVRLRVVIVDDEEPARLALRQDLAAFGDVEIVAECANGFEAVKAVGDAKPDVILLDVQMPKLNGFEVLELLGGDVPVVFVTAYDEFAIKAFEVHAVDYLLKPVTHAAPRLGAGARAGAAGRRSVAGGAEDGRTAAGRAARARRHPRRRAGARRARRRRSTTSRRRTTTSASGRAARPCSRSRRWATSKRSSTAGGSCAFTGRIC